tara:strand:+ start:665 stop:1108 length:444 start_codon:yes stop_codon:yes gene_type:complete
MNSSYPRVFRYSDGNSIQKNANADLKVSFETQTIARNRRVGIGDSVVVVARNNKSEEMSLFVCEVVSEIGVTELWKKQGGKKWKCGYTVKPLSEVITLHKIVVEAIMDQAFSWRLFDGLAFSNPYIMHRNGSAMKKLFAYCASNHPV